MSSQVKGAAIGQGASARDTGLIVGNGASIDLGSHFPGRLRKWNTSRPLSWNVPNLSNRLAELLPDAAKAILETKVSKPDLSDFAVFDEIVNPIIESKVDNSDVLAQLRHLIVLYYSEYQRVADFCNRNRVWPLIRWLQNNHSRISAVVSFNYDLNIERALSSTQSPVINTMVHGYQAAAVGRAVHLAKPHGSLDLDMGGSVILVVPALPPRLTMTRCNYPVEEVAQSNLRKPRKAATVVLPAETSYYASCQWVRPPMTAILHEAPKWRRMIIVGLSFWGVDRNELNQIFMQCEEGTEIVVVDPAPNESLMELLNERYIAVTHLRSTEELDASG